MSSIFLLGFRGAGKTTLGRALAAQLRWEFSDCDEAWRDVHGGTIEAFVAAHGLEEFRRTEANVLAGLLERAEREPNLVVATGGGCVDWEPSRTLLQAFRGGKVYLEVPAEELWARLSSDPKRLEIGKLATFEQMNALLSLRLPHYEKIASYRLPNRDISGALTELASLVKK